MGRLLALDLGERRVGVAVSDPLGVTAQGLPTIERRGASADTLAIGDLAARHGAERIIVGLPLTLGGEEGPAARGARRFAAGLRQALDLPVDLWDERLTTAEAARLLREDGLGPRRRRGHLDRMAAVLILQSWLDAHSPAPC